MTNVMPPGPLAYEGAVATPYILKTFPPTTDFNQFNVPTIWVDFLNENAYILVSKNGGVAEWVQVGSIPGGISTITTPDATVVVPVAGNVNFLNGTGMTITGSGNNITFNATSNIFAWVEVTSGSTNLVPTMGYFANGGGQLTFVLPTTANVGDTYSISAVNAAGWTLTQNANQQIQIGIDNTTLGVGGSLTSTAIGNTITLVCSQQDTKFMVISSMGNITVV